MAAESLAKLTTDQLKKKEKADNIEIIAFPIIFAVCFIAATILKPALAGAAIPLLAPVVISVRSRKRIREELKKRDSKV